MKAESTECPDLSAIPRNERGIEVYDCLTNQLETVTGRDAEYVIYEVRDLNDVLFFGVFRFYVGVVYDLMLAGF